MDYRLYCLLMGLWAVRSCQNLIKAKIAATHYFSSYFEWFALGRSKLDANLFTSQFLPRSLFAYLWRIFQRLHFSWQLCDPLTLLPLFFYCPFLSPDLFQTPGTPAAPRKASAITNDKVEVSSAGSPSVRGGSSASWKGKPNSSLAYSFPIMVFCPWN